MKFINKLKQIFTVAYARESFEKWFYRSSPFRVTPRQITIANTLTEKRIKLWRKKYLEGRDAGKILLLHFGLDRLRIAFYSNDIKECFNVLEEIKKSQEELGFYMIELQAIEEQILDLQKRINSRIRNPDRTSKFGQHLIRSLPKK